MLIGLAINLLVQSTILLAVGLLIHYQLRRNPQLQSLAGRWLLAGVSLLVLLTCFGNYHLPTLYHLNAPLILVKSDPAWPPTLLPNIVVPESDSTSFLAQISTHHQPPLPAPLKASLTTQFNTSSQSNRPSREIIFRFTLLVLTVVWGCGSCLLLVRLLYGHISITRIRRRSHTVYTGSSFSLLRQLCATHQVSPPLLQISSEVSSPLVTGLWRPAILLPCDFERDFDGPGQAAIFTHELAHLKQHDLWCRWVMRVLCLVLWPQPLLWLFCSHLEEVQERVCDETVLANGCLPREYARYLLNLADKLVVTPDRRLVGAAASPFRSTLATRIQHIVSGSNNSPSRIKPSTCCFMVMSVVCSTLAAFTLIAVDTKPDQFHNSTDLRPISSQPWPTSRSTVASLNPGKSLAGIALSPDPYTRIVQYLLSAHGYKVRVDGIYGTQTRHAVGQFQTTRHLKADGLINGATQQKLVIPLQRGNRGDAVRAAQELLNSSGSPSLTRLHILVDGYYGAQTQQATTQFQRRHRLREDGILDDKTWQQLLQA